LLHGVVELGRLDVEVVEDPLSQGGGHPPIKLLGKLRRQIRAVDQGFLEAVDPLRFLDQIGHGGLRDAGVLVFQQRLYDVLVAFLDQRVGDCLTEVAPAGDGDLMLPAAVVNDADQVRVAQQPAFHKDRFGHLDRVVGQVDDEIVRGIAALGQTVTQALADGLLEVA
jgi:hypothetical protein